MSDIRISLIRDGQSYFWEARFLGEEDILYKTEYRWLNSDSPAQLFVAILTKDYEKIVGVVADAEEKIAAVEEIWPRTSAVYLEQPLGE